MIDLKGRVITVGDQVMGGFVDGIISPSDVILYFGIGSDGEPRKVKVSGSIIVTEPHDKLPTNGWWTCFPPTKACLP